MNQPQELEVLKQATELADKVITYCEEVQHHCDDLLQSIVEWQNNTQKMLDEYSSPFARGDE